MRMVRAPDVISVPVDVMPMGIHAMAVTVIPRRCVGVMGIHIPARDEMPVDAVMMPRMPIAIRAMIVPIARFG